jgi:uncharacterized Zn finger protein
MTPIANILHRETISALVGERTFARGDRCYRAKRVLVVKAMSGQLLGIVQPSESTRARYEVRIWSKEDGLAYRCSCPVGIEGRFCKHAVAIALAHIEELQHEAEKHMSELHRALMLIPHADLVAKLMATSHEDDRMRVALEQLVT